MIRTVCFVGCLVLSAAGGATAMFRATGSMERTLVIGRWAYTRTARLHIFTGLAETFGLNITPAQRGLFVVPYP